MDSIYGAARHKNLLELERYINVIKWNHCLDRFYSNHSVN